MRPFIVAVAVFAGALLPSAHAQDDDLAAVEEAPEPAAPEVVQAWAVPVEEAGRQEESDQNESAAWTRIHDADAALLEVEAAERMIGFDVLDGAR